MTQNNYYLMEPPPAEAVEPCPCCGSSARVWVYAEAPTMPDEGAGLSWDGFNVRGDAQSVREVRRLVEFHAARSPERPNQGIDVSTVRMQEIAPDDELTALRAQVEALRKDAERYRWLRIQPNDTSAPRLDIVRWTASDESANEGEGLRFARADEAIDEAMKGQS